MAQTNLYQTHDSTKTSSLQQIYKYPSIIHYAFQQINKDSAKQGVRLLVVPHKAVAEVSETGNL
jgi:hypothetical protein